MESSTPVASSSSLDAETRSLIEFAFEHFSEGRWQRSRGAAPVDGDSRALPHEGLVHALRGAGCVMGSEDYLRDTIVSLCGAEQDFYSLKEFIAIRAVFPSLLRGVAADAVDGGCAGRQMKDALLALRLFATFERGGVVATSTLRTVLTTSGDLLSADEAAYVLHKAPPMLDFTQFLDIFHLL